MIVVTAQLVALLVLLALSAFFSSSEVAFFSLNNLQVNRLRRRESRGSRRLQTLLANPSRLLSTILTGNTLVNVGASILGFTLALSLQWQHAELLAVVLMTFLLLLFGEMAPKRMAMMRPERMALCYAPLMSLLQRGLRPMSRALEKSAELMEQAMRPGDPVLNDDELRTVMDIGREAGSLSDEERNMLRAVMRLQELRASDVMTPRVDLAAVDLSDPPPDLDSWLRRIGLRQVLLYRERMDHTEGFLDVRAYLLDGQRRMDRAWMHPYYVPETVACDRLLADLRQRGLHAAVVVDEYGGTAGVITLRDLIEALTGVMGDESSRPAPAIQPVGPRRWLMDGMVSLEEINDRLMLELDPQGNDRLAGWVVAQLGRLPRAGDEVEAQGVRATVQRARKRSVELVLFEIRDHAGSREQ